MNVDGSWIFGAVTGGLTIAIPQWIYTQGWSPNHTVLLGILVGVIGMCAAGYGFDFLFNTGSVIFVIITAAFIYHNFYSLVANIAVLGWEKHFPMWLLNWLDNEIAAKKEKYFPTKKEEK